MPPKISCILLTKNRSRWLPRAVEMFHRQTWSNKELIIAERQDNNDYVQLPRYRDVIRLKMGRALVPERNRKAILTASGEFIAYWEDDDWIGPERLEKQVRPILSGEASMNGMPIRTVTTLMLRSMKFYMVEYIIANRTKPDPFKGILPGLPCMDGTLMFKRGFFYGDQDEALRLGKIEFMRTMRKRGCVFKVFEAAKHYVYVRHNSNLSTFDQKHKLHPIDRPDWVPEDQWAFWRKMRARGA